MRTKYLGTILAVIGMILAPFGTARATLILGDRDGSGSGNGLVCTEQEDQKTDGAVIFTFTSVIFTLTGVIFTFADTDKEVENTNCGIILSD